MSSLNDRPRMSQSGPTERHGSIGTGPQGRGFPVPTKSHLQPENLGQRQLDEGNDRQRGPRSAAMTHGKGRSTPTNCLLADFPRPASPTPSGEPTRQAMPHHAHFLVRGLLPFPRGARGQTHGQGSWAARLAPLGRQTYGPGALMTRADHVPGQPPERRFNDHCEAERQEVEPPRASLTPRFAPALASRRMTTELRCETKRSGWSVSSNTTDRQRTRVTPGQIDDSSWQGRASRPMAPLAVCGFGYESHAKC